eukprot:1307626-Alexandrium_andersonii.AAC.1
MLFSRLPDTSKGSGNGQRPGEAQGTAGSETAYSLLPLCRWSSLCRVLTFSAHRRMAIAQAHNPSSVQTLGVGTAAHVEGFGPVYTLTST